MTESSPPPASGARLLALSGEVDIARVEEILEEAARCLDATGATLEIDLRGVTFIDSSGLGALVHVRNEAQRIGKDIVLIEVPRSVARVLAVSGLDQVFDIRPGD